MNKQQLIIRLTELEKLENKLSNEIANSPQGKIRCEMLHGRYPQYYIAGDGLTDCEGERYLRRDEEEIARVLVQKEYDKKLLSAVLKCEKTVKGMLNGPDISDFTDIYEKMPRAKQMLVQPYFQPDDQFIKVWELQFPEGQNEYPINNGFVTERGETVRSKSEKMIADKLFMRGIPYRYETKLVLAYRNTLFPDFTVLNVRTRETYYYEHFGMMDNPDYCKHALEKIDTYEENGIYLGEKLIITMESSQKGININLLNSIVDRYFV